MSEGIAPRPGTNQAQTIALFSATIAWQVYVVISTYFHAATFAKLFKGLGAELPPLTRLFFATYRWWFLVPVAFIALFVVRLRGPQTTRWQTAALLGGSLLAGFALQAFATEALSGPMFSLIEQIG